MDTIFKFVTTTFGRSVVGGMLAILAGGNIFQFVYMQNMHTTHNAAMDAARAEIVATERRCSEQINQHVRDQIALYEELIRRQAATERRIKKR